VQKRAALFLQQLTLLVFHIQISGQGNISVNDQTIPIFNAPKSDEDEFPAFAWYHDSYPFVCVTMLSDCVGMAGGETALKTAWGEIMKVRGPAMLC
jgi:hypothetical protein